MCNASCSILSARAVERVWGRTHLPSGFESFQTGAAIGEIWHERTGLESQLLVKHIFTSERLSIQVHPGDEAAKARGYKRGKDEAWLVLDAEPGATIGIGLTREISRDELRAAALSGEIDNLVDWRPVARGDFFYSPAGTLHAIGAGLSVLEVQQNLDLTYRLYDYGRPRELHLYEGIAIAEPRPWSFDTGAHALGPVRSVLVRGGLFVVEEWVIERSVRVDPRGEPLLLIPVEGSGYCAGKALDAGSVASVDAAAELVAEGNLKLLVAYPGAAVRKSIWQG